MDSAPRVGAGVAAPSELVVAVPPELDAICRSTLNQRSGPESLENLADQLRPWSTTRVTKVTHRPVRRDEGTAATSLMTPVGSGASTSQQPSSPSIGERIQSRREERVAAERRDLEERRADPQYLNLREALAVGTGTDGAETSIAPGIPALETRDGRFAKPIMGAVVAGVLLATAAAVPVLLNTVPDSTTPADATTEQTQPSTPAPGPTPTSQAPATTASTEPVTIASAGSIDPDGDGQENEDTAARVFDGDAESEWRTERYDSQDNVGGRKVGVGVALRLEQASTVNGVRVEGRTGQSFTIYTNSSDSLDGATEIGKVDDAGGQSDVRVDPPAEDVQYVIVLLTGLPEEDGSYRGGISEVQVY